MIVSANDTTGPLIIMLTLKWNLPVINTLGVGGDPNRYLRMYSIWENPDLCTVYVPLLCCVVFALVTEHVSPGV